MRPDRATRRQTDIDLAIEGSRTPSGPTSSPNATSTHHAHIGRLCDSFEGRFLDSIRNDAAVHLCLS